MNRAVRAELSFDSRGFAGDSNDAHSVRALAGVTSGHHHEANAEGDEPAGKASLKMGHHVSVISARASPVNGSCFNTDCIDSLLLSRAEEQIRRIGRHQVKKARGVRDKQSRKRLPDNQITDDSDVEPA
jgi:hypothetical protein